MTALRTRESGMMATCPATRISAFLATSASAGRAGCAMEAVSLIELVQTPMWKRADRHERDNSPISSAATVVKGHHSCKARRARERLAFGQPICEGVRDYFGKSIKRGRGAIGLLPGEPPEAASRRRAELLDRCVFVDADILRRAFVGHAGHPACQRERATREKKDPARGRAQPEEPTGSTFGPHREAQHENTSQDTNQKPKRGADHPRALDIVGLHGAVHVRLDEVGLRLFRRHVEEGLADATARAK